MSLAKILPLLIAAAPIALATPALAQSGPAAGITTQLPRGAVPSHYAIEVTPDAANLKFTGKVTIDVTVSTAMPALRRGCGPNWRRAQSGTCRVRAR